MSVTDSLIEVRNLRFRYGEHDVLEGVSFAVRGGEIYGLVGADGAGKTTLLRLAAGQLTGAEGTLRVLGKDPTAPALREDIAYMPQGFGLYRDLSVLENLEFFSDLHDLSATSAQTRIADLLQRTGLNGFEGRRAGQLSGGMMQKLALACALVSEPRVMFLDEPTTGVDPVSRRAFWRLLEGVRADGVAIFYATANMDEAERCNHIGLLQRGRLSMQGTPEELLARTELNFVEITGTNARALRERVREVDGVRLLYPVGQRLNAWLDPSLSLTGLQQRLTQVGLQAEARRPTLHDAALYQLATAAEHSQRDAH